MPYQTRLKKLQQLLQQAACDALLIDDQTNLYYLTGLDLSAGKLLVHAHGSVLLVDGRYFETCQKTSPFPVRLMDASGLKSLLADKEFASIRRLAFDSEKTSFKTYTELSKLVEAMKSHQLAIELIPLEAPLQTLRLIKDEGEISLLRQAADMGSQGFDFVCSLLCEGITELEVATELEIFWKRQGAKGLAFDPIIAFGANSSMPHYRAGGTKLRRGDVVLIDIGVNYRHYHSDMTRIVYFGAPDACISAIHAIVKRAQRAALALCRPGVTVGELDAAARDLIAAQGYGPQFSHSLGHGVGLDIHEYPTIKNTPPLNALPLAAGMVITIEPGIYLAGIGGIRIEDTVVITENGCENLTKRPTDAILIP